MARKTDGIACRLAVSRTLRSFSNNFLIRASGLLKLPLLIIVSGDAASFKAALQCSLLVRAAKVRVPHVRMPTLILSTLALLGCAFMIYVFFDWLRDELNPKRPPASSRRPFRLPEPRRPYVLRVPPHEHARRLVPGASASRSAETRPGTRGKDAPASGFGRHQGKDKMAS
jgi:hypothetical protein